MTDNTLIATEQLNTMPVVSIAQATERFSQVAEFTKEIMRENVDFGIVPGTSKPTLLKPGAEKLTTFFGLSKRFEIIEKVEDWTGKDYNGEPFFYYLYRCSLYRGDILIAESDGSCNSFEAKYRWRKAERTCPECGQANIRKSKQGGGWYCWAKTGGCGATFPAGHAEIEKQEVGRIPNPDICDQVNTFQKMSQKRALVAATLLAVNASEFFTQDVEDYITADYEVVSENTPPPKSKSKPPVQSASAPKKPAAKTQSKKQQHRTPVDDFFDSVQKQTNNYYSHKTHLYNSLDKRWPDFNDQNDVGAAQQSAIVHAKKRTDEKAAADEEIPF